MNIVKLKVVIFITVLFSVVFISCIKKNEEIISGKHSVISTDFLVGTWVYENCYGKLYEEWKNINDTLCQGRCFIINNTDTIILETTNLERTSEGLIYSTKMENYGKDSKVIMSLLNFSDKHIEFYNPKCRFFQKISYAQVNQDSLIIEVFSDHLSHEKAMTYDMVRIN